MDQEIARNSIRIHIYAQLHLTIQNSKGTHVGYFSLITKTEGSNFYTVYCLGYEHFTSYKIDPHRRTADRERDIQKKGAAAQDTPRDEVKYIVGNTTLAARIFVDTQSLSLLRNFGMSSG